MCWSGMRVRGYLTVAWIGRPRQAGIQVEHTGAAVLLGKGFHCLERYSSPLGSASAPPETPTLTFSLPSILGLPGSYTKIQIFPRIGHVILVACQLLSAWNIITGVVALKGVHVLIPGPLTLVTFMVTGVIKLQILRWESTPGCPGGPV